MLAWRFRDTGSPSALGLSSVIAIADQNQPVEVVELLSGHPRELLACTSNLLNRASGECSSGRDEKESAPSL
jgi:hypothetical protein